MTWISRLAVFAALMCLASMASVASAASNDEGHDNFFASILLDGKKIGHIHYSVQHNEQGELEELRTKASLSVLGVRLYDFSQNLHEQWSGGELQTLKGHTNDDGTVYRTDLKRTATNYEATLNDEPLTLPHDAFPISLWHYAVSQQSLLFDLQTLELLEVAISGHEEALSWNGETIQTERFDITGDWQGSVWFDRDKRFMKAEYLSNKRKVTVVLDP